MKALGYKQINKQLKARHTNNTLFRYRRAASFHKFFTDIQSNMTKCHAHRGAESSGECTDSKSG